MLDALFAHRQLALLASGWGVLLFVAAAERFFPRRPPARPRPRRWGSHLALAAGNLTITRAVLPFGTGAASVWAARHDVGFLNALALPRASAVVATVLLLDFVSYAIHRLVHAVPLLWRLHRVHHADADLDWSTGLRQHPVSVLFSTCVRFAAVVALGAAPLGVLLYAVLARPLDRVGHANLRLPPRLDAWLRLVVVTPDAHAVHHSARPEETDSNFGTALLLWDRLFGTYRAAPADGLAGMTIGLERFRETRDCDLDRILLLPLRGEEAAPAPVAGLAGAASD